MSHRARLGLLAWTVLSLLLLIAALAWVRPAVAAGPGDALLLMAVVATPVAAVAPLVRPRWLVLCCLAGGALISVRTGMPMRLDPVNLVLVAVVVGGVLALYVLSFWLSGWMLRVVWALEDARGAAARLAITEERLRISRDLHDVFGRTLAAVAVKSELAAELIRRGRPEAAGAEMVAVRGLADDTGREMREVVRGFRRPDLEAELAGARSLLESAGIGCDLDNRLRAPVREAAAAALGWVLREAVTNVIRHSDATRCSIRLEDGDPIRLTVDNDGAGSATATTTADGGSGLRGMAERLSAVGGRLVHESDGSRFRVRAEVPATAPRHAGTAEASTVEAS